MRVAMIGTGYVGLVSGVCFSDFGHDVICVDKDEAKIAKLKRQIAEGSYEVDADAVAEKMLARDVLKRGDDEETTEIGRADGPADDERTAKNAPAPGDDEAVDEETADLKLDAEDTSP